MALMSQWYFTETATLWSYTGRDPMTLQNSYADPVLISCGIEGKSVVSVDRNGKEFVVSTTYYTGHPGIKPLDFIDRGAHTGTVQGDEVKNVRRHGMAAFGYADEFTVEV